MDQLPQELISHIATFLEREDDQSHVPLLFRRREPSKLPPYATISRKWQYAIERLTFPEIWLKSTEMDYFSETMLAHRRRSLAVLQYEIVLPTYGEARCAKFETDDEKRLNNECFTDAIHALFRVMKSWEGTEGPETLHHTQAICLNLYAPYSPMDGIRRGPEKYKKDKWSSGIGERDDLWEHRYEHSVLRLSNSRDLPSLSSISELYGNLHYVRSIEPRSIVEILAKLDNLKSVRVTLKENEKKDRQMQQDDRKGFAQALSTIKHPSLSSFHLKFYNESPMNQSSDLHSALAPFSSSHDDLSLALHKYSQSPILIDFTLEGPIVISPTLFWPSDPPITPVWPSITNFHVDFNLNTPNGEWYFIRDPENNDESDEDEDDDEQEESSDDSDDDSVLSYDSLVPDTFNARKEARATGDLPARCFRTKPDSEKINPLLVAMARAAGQMPKLERMSLTARLICAEKSYFELDYLAPGVEMLYVEKIGDVKKPRLYWHVGKWRPDEEVLRLWREGKGVEQEILVSFLEY